MARFLPTRPGWYRNPDDPESMRYWDGTAWSGRARRWPPWSTRAEPFELCQGKADRSIEGPVHPHELREPVASGAGAHQWLPWRSGHAGSGWHRGAWSHTPRPWRPPHLPAPAKLGPARRPLLALACLVVVAVAVVVSGVAFISPYETRGKLAARSDAAAARFVEQAGKECATTLPRYRRTLARGTDGPKISVAAHQVELLRQRLSSIHTAPGIEGPVQEWLGRLNDFATANARYAAIIGSPVRVDGRRVPRHLGPTAEEKALRARRLAATAAQDADNFSTNLGLTACHLEPLPLG
ncbi:MAG: hypothetical protein ACRDZX_04220 [Acidimicrobiales bacterium]